MEELTGFGIVKALHMPVISFDDIRQFTTLLHFTEELLNDGIECIVRSRRKTPGEGVGLTDIEGDIQFWIELPHQGNLVGIGDGNLYFLLQNQR